MDWKELICRTCEEIPCAFDDRQIYSDSCKTGPMCPDGLTGWTTKASIQATIPVQKGSVLSHFYTYCVYSKDLTFLKT